MSLSIKTVICVVKYFTFQGICDFECTKTYLFYLIDIYVNRSVSLPLLYALPDCDKNFQTMDDHSYNDRFHGYY